MKVTQALVLVGGQATRLHASSVEVPLSKSFLELAHKPLFHWNLMSLHQAGIRRLVIAAEKSPLLYAAEQVISHHPCRFEQVTYFQDEGLGVHGIPYHLRYLLDDTYIFDCGHSLSTPAHYKRLQLLRKENLVVFSAFRSHPKNPRPLATAASTRTIASHWALAHPMVCTRAYARSLFDLDFDIRKAIVFYVKRKRLAYSTGILPPEFDIAEELEIALNAYGQYLKKTAYTK